MKKEKGQVLIVALLTLAILLILGYYFLSFAITETKISKSQEIGTKTYYLTEAGINEALWKLKNDNTTDDGDPPWATCFISTSTEFCPDCDIAWTATFVKDTDFLVPNSTTTVTIERPRCGSGELFAASTILISDEKSSQRLVKVGVSKPYESLTKDSPLFSGFPSGESTIDSSIMNIYNGNIFVNNNLRIRNLSQVNVFDNPETEGKEGKALVVGNCIVTGSDLNATATCCSDKCISTSTCDCLDKTIFDQWCQDGKCPPKAIDMPVIDFDSPDQNSYKMKAKAAQEQGQCSVKGKKIFGPLTLLSQNCIFSEKEFKGFLDWVGWGGTLILEHKTNGIAVSTYYVEGEISLGEQKRLEINGVLVADKSIYIGWWTPAYLVINDPGPGIPSGLLTKGKMNFGGFLFQEVNVTGLIYSAKEMGLISFPYTFNVVGGIIASKFDFRYSWLNPLNIYLDNDRIREGIWAGPQPPGEETPPYSPIITIEHWEEAY